MHCAEGFSPHDEKLFQSETLTRLYAWLSLWNCRNSVYKFRLKQSKLIQSTTVGLCEISFEVVVTLSKVKKKGT